MKMKNLFALIISMAIAIPTMLAQTTQDAIYVSVSSAGSVNPSTVADPLTDAKLLLTGTAGVYKGEVHLTLNRPFLFYKVVDGQKVWLGATSKTVPTYLTKNDFENGVVTFDTEQGSNQYWMVYGSYPENCNGDFQLSVNTNTNTATLSTMAAKAPEHIYIWYSTKGADKQSYFSNIVTLSPSADNTNVFKGEAFLPYVESFTNTDAESGEVDYQGTGVCMYLSDSNANWIGNGITTYGLPMETDMRINIPEAGSKYEITLSSDKSGSFLNIENAGLVAFTFNWETNEFTAEMLAPNASSDDVIYVATNSSLYGTFQTNDTDPVLYLNKETGWYSGATIEVPKLQYAWKFYRKNGSDIEWIGAIIPQAVNFATSNPYESTYEEGSSAWRVIGFDGTTEGEIALAINPTTHQVIFTQTNAVMVIPEAVYLWGAIKEASGNGSGEDTNDIRYSVVGTLVPTEENSSVFTLTTDIPEVTKGSEFLFFLSKNEDTYKKLNDNYFGAYTSTNQDNTEGFPPALDFSNSGTMTMQLYSGTITPSGMATSSISDSFPGSTTFTFDFETKMLTAVYNEFEEPETPTYEVTFNFTDVENVVTVTDGAGQSLAYSDGTLAYEYSEESVLTFTATEGYYITLTCTNGVEGDNTYLLQANEDMSEIRISLRAGADGYVFSVNASETDSVKEILESCKAINVVDLNGTVLVRDGDAKAIKALPKGIYVVNGKKVVVK